MYHVIECVLCELLLNIKIRFLSPYLIELIDLRDM